MRKERVENGWRMNARMNGWNEKMGETKAFVWEWSGKEREKKKGERQRETEMDGW